MNIYLYIKTHNVTGLKYLGKTTKDPFTYYGSGGEWKKHLKENGNNVTTEILGSYDNKKDFQTAGRYYSKLWNIVESKDWANLIPETGGGNGNRGKRSEETIEKYRQANLGRTPWNKGKKCKNLTEDHKEKISKNHNSLSNPVGVKRGPYKKH